MTPDNRLQLLSLIAAYAFGYDDLNWKLFASIWTEDARLKGSFGQRQGLNEIVNSARQKREALDSQGIQTRHLQSNTMFETYNEKHISTRSTFAVSWQNLEQSNPVIKHTGIYQDEFYRTNDGWRIACRIIYLDQDKLRSRAI